MSKIFTYLRDFVREDFNAGYYGSVVLFLAVALWFNYEHDFKRSVLNPTLAQPFGVLWFFAFYALPYTFAAVTRAFFYRQRDLLARKAFWGAAIFVALAMSFDNYSVALPRLLLEVADVPVPLRDWVGASLRNLDRTLGIFIPVLLYWLCVDRGRSSFYGLTFRGFDWRPYAAMLGIMTPLVVWASFQPSFLAAYPTYRAGEAEAYLGVSREVTFALYEVTRASRFVTIELFFRGLLVLGLSRHLGRAALMPMVALYTFWHFGKPLPEAIGSAVAAYTLGVIALRTRSIAGGIMLHIGVAMLMEFTAYLQHYARI